MVSLWWLRIKIVGSLLHCKFYLICGQVDLLRCDCPRTWYPVCASRDQLRLPGGCQEIRAPGWKNSTSWWIGWCLVISRISRGQVFENDAEGVIRRGLSREDEEDQVQAIGDGISHSSVRGTLASFWDLWACYEDYFSWRLATVDQAALSELGKMFGRPTSMAE